MKLPFEMVLLAVVQLEHNYAEKRVSATKHVEETMALVESCGWNPDEFTDKMNELEEFKDELK